MVWGTEIANCGKCNKCPYRQLQDKVTRTSDRTGTVVTMVTQDGIRRFSPLPWLPDSHRYYGYQILTVIMVTMVTHRSNIDARMTDPLLINPIITMNRYISVIISTSIVSRSHMLVILRPSNDSPELHASLELAILCVCC